MPHLPDMFRDDIAQAVAAKLNAMNTQEAAAAPSQTGQTGQTGQSGQATVQPKDVARLLTLPPQFELGQAALPCFPFAKALKLPPPRIAGSLAEDPALTAPGSIERVEAVNGYLNFHAHFPVYGADVLARIRSGQAFHETFLEAEETDKIVVEFFQPNTHKALHVGHLRCLVLGDAVCSLLSYIGHTVVRATYPGDLGAHIAKALWYLKHRHAGPVPASHRADWLGNVYARADEAIKAETGTPQELENRAQIAAILQELQERKGASHDLWKETREWSLEEMREVNAWMGVHFDAWYTESECDAPSRALVQKKFEDGFFVKDQGAVGIDLSPYKLGFAMFLKSDGNGLYITKDLELLRRKFEDPAVTKSVVVIDFRQKLHFQQLYKTAELMGYPQAAKSSALLYETVNTGNGEPFSSRQLNGLKLFELKEQMERKVTQDYLERYRGVWTDEDVRKTAEIVTVGALRYGMLKVDNNTQITFVLDEWLRLDGETGPYLQYVHARCCNILEKQGRPAPRFAFTLEDKVEKELTFFLARFNEFAFNAGTQMRPSVLAGYLYDLAKFFNRFYEACPIRSVTGDLRDTRLALVESVAATMARGLGLLGIPAPQRM